MEEADMRRIGVLALPLAVWAIQAAGCSCSDRHGGDDDGTSDGASDGTDTGGDWTGDLPGDWGDADDDDGGGGSILTGTIRDFSDTHPDFEDDLADDRGIVEDVIGTDDKPVYAGGDGTATTHGQEAFDQWYRDTPGVNMSAPYTIALTDPESDGVWTYDNPEFFPIDDQLLGNEGREHNYHFTFEVHTRFTYEGGEVFGFTGDDDLWVFVNGHLGIDLGGVHGPENGTIDFDAMASELEISPGGSYTLDFFFAERHTTQSNFRIDTTIEEFIII